MANQDSGFIALHCSLDAIVSGKQYYNASVSFTGSLDAIVSGKQYYNASVVLTGTLNSNVSATQVGVTFTSMTGTGSMKVSGSVYQNSGLIQLSGSLSGTESYQVLVNAYVSMYGFLSGGTRLYSSVRCSDLPINFNTQIIESLGCTIKGESVELIRYRGDTYPVSTTLSKNGSTDTAGITFKMSTQIGGGVIYTVDGIIENASNGIVNFPLSTDAVSTSGSGVYDIQGDDGTYIYTYEKGVFTLLDDVTV